MAAGLGAIIWTSDPDDIRTLIDGPDTGQETRPCHPHRLGGLLDRCRAEGGCLVVDLLFAEGAVEVVL